MKRILQLFVLITALVESGNAQVTNDNCQNAISLDSIFWGFPGVNCFNFTLVDTSVISSNNNALVDFPYPAYPLPCNGYTPNLSAPANDVWYVIDFVEGCDLNVLSSCTDTTHIVFWFGDSCSYLAHAACVTLLPGDTSFTIPGNSYSKTFIQISGNGINQFTDFTFCFSSGPLCIPTFYSGLPTPYICMDYNTSVTNASSTTSNDGSIFVNINAGNPPYQIQWNDGGSGFQRNNLAPGQYSYTIVDSVGCTTSDTITVGTLTGIGNYINAKCFDQLETIASAQRIETFLNESEISEFYMFNTLGVLVCDENNYKNRLSSLPQGVYFLRLLKGSDQCFTQIYLLNLN